MGVESVNNPLVAQSVPELEVGSEEVSASVTSILPDLTPEFKTMGFNSLGVFGMQALSSSTTYTLADLGADLITFSTLAEAKKWAGADVETVYFRKVVVGGVTYLEPLKAKRSSDINYSKMDANELEFESAGDSIAFTATLPTASEFLKLHTAEQNALVALKGTSKTVSYTAPKTGSMTYIELVYSASGNEPAVTAVLSQDGKKAYIVDKLQTRDFSFMPFDDQYAISKTAAFSGPSGIGAKLGLTTSTATAVAAVQAAIDKINKEFKDAPWNLYRYRPAISTVPITPAQYVQITGIENSDPKGYFTTDHRDLFIKQLNLIKEEISNDMAVFNMTAINDKIGAIGERFTRALAFGNIPAAIISTSPVVLSSNPSDMARFMAQTSGTKYETSHGLDMHGQIAGYPYLLSADDNKTVKEGFDKFIAQEKIYHENAKSRRDLVKDISTNNLMLDAPTLLYRLQIHYNIESDANIACASEELRQQNDLLNSYSKAQQLISQTISINKKAFFVANNYGPEKNPRNQGNKKDRTVLINDEEWVPRYWGDVPRYEGDQAPSSDGDDVLKRIAMFQTDNASLGGKAPLHPIEKMRGISRPYLKITGLKPNHSKDPDYGYGWPQKLDVATWQQYGNQLSETVNLIGQETQNVLNKISGFEKDKGRYTDMASNTLSKLNEAIMAIGRSL